MKTKTFILPLFLIFTFLGKSVAQKKHDIIVAQDGSGDFKSIQEVINLLPQTSNKQRVILIKKGIYQEKIFIEKEKITLKGEKESEVKIIISEARDIWRCEHPDDWGAAVLNLKANDIMLENLTVINDYGFSAKGDSLVRCINDTTKQKFIRKDGHQFALRAMPPTTRLIVKNCTFRALGGDTVSPWDTANGMYYFKDCTMEGGVDFYCPRGWAYAENCRFICHSKNAAIWHDGSQSQDCKTVLKNCTFEGDNGFKLGRYHKEAQFYLLNCTFAKNMADAAIYWVATASTPILWGERVYYYNCHRKGGDFEWHKNNLKHVNPKKINVDWVFGKRWRIR